MTTELRALQFVPWSNSLTRMIGKESKKYVIYFVNARIAFHEAIRAFVERDRRTSLRKL